MNTLVRMNKMNGMPTITTVVEVYTQVSLVSMGSFIPQVNVAIILAVCTQLVEDKMGINGGLDEITTIRSRGKSPLQVVLVSVGASVPNGDVGFIVGSSTMNVSNGGRSNSRNEKESLV